MELCEKALENQEVFPKDSENAVFKFFRTCYVYFISCLIVSKHFYGISSMLTECIHELRNIIQ